MARTRQLYVTYIHTYIHTHVPLVQCITFPFYAVFVSADLVQIRKSLLLNISIVFKVTKSKIRLQKKFTILLCSLR